MASAYGIIHQYGEPDSLFNPELAAGVLQHRQQKYDANIIKVEQTLQQLGLSTSMMLRPEDKEYMYEKVNGLIQSIPNLKNTDFSSNQATRSILTRVNEALDDHVIKHLGESKKVRDFQSQMQTLQQENPEAYSEVNYQDAMMQSGFYDYMNPESGVDSMKSFNYTPYVDYQSEMLERIEQAKKVIGEQEIDFVDTDGVAKKKSISNMTISEWMTYMPNLVSADMDAQMRVEAREAYGWNDQKAQEEVQALKSSIEEDFDKRIARQKLAMSKTNNPKQRQLFKNEIATYEAKKKEAIKGLNENVTAEQAGYQKIYQRMVRDNAALVGSDPSLTFLNAKQFGDGKMPGSQQDVWDSIGIIGSSDMILDDSQIGDLTTEDFESRENKARKTYTEWSNRGENFAKNLKSDDFDYEEKFKSYKDSGYSEKDAKFQVVQDAYKKAGKWGELTAGAAAQRKYKQELDIKEQAYTKTISKDIFLTNSEPILKALKEEGVLDRQKIVIDGKEISSKQFLEEEEIDTEQDLKDFINDNEKSSELVSQIFGDFFLNEVSQNAMGGKTNIGTALKKGGEGRLARISTADLHNHDRWMRSLNLEGRELTDDFKVTLGKSASQPTFNFLLGNFSNFISGQEERELTSDEIRQLSKDAKFVSDVKIELREDADPKVKEALNKRLKYVTEEDSYTVLQQVLNTPRDLARTLAGGDSNFYDDKAIRKLFKYGSSDYKDTYTKALKQGEITVNTPKKIAIEAETSKSKRKTAVKELISVTSSSTTEGQYEYSPDKPSEIMVDPSDPEYVLVYQFNEKQYLDDKKKLTRSSETPIAKVPLSLFQQQAPTLSSQLDFSQAAGELNMNTRIEETAEGLDFMDDTDDKQVQSFYKATQNEALTRKASAGFAKEMLNTQNRQLFDSQPMLRTVMTEAIDNPSRFRIRMQEDDEGVLGATVDVNTAPPNAQQKDYEQLTRITFDPDEAEMALTSFDIAPQVFLTDALQKIAMLYQQQGSRSIDENPKTNLLLQSLFQNQDN